MAPGDRVPGICVVGCGAWGGVHAHALHVMGGRVRRFFASRNVERAKAFAARFSGEAVFDGAEAAFADPRVTAVILVTPHDSHAPLARAALLAGKHVLVEKPIALTVEDATRLVRLADQNGLCLGVAEQYRLSPLVRALGRALDEGWIGRVVFAHACAVTTYLPDAPWKRDADASGGGVLLDVGIHYVDLLRSLFGDPVRIHASVPLSERDGPERTATAHLSFHRDVTSCMTITWRGHRSSGSPNLEVIGEEGALEVDFLRPWLFHSRPLRRDHWSRRLRTALPWRFRRRWAATFGPLPESRQQRIRVPAADLIGSQALIEDFVAAFTGQRAPAVTGADGARDLAVVLAAYDSVRSGTTMPFHDPFPGAPGATTGSADPGQS